MLASRRSALLASAGLLAAGIVVVTTAAPSGAATFTERWCTTTPAPCVVAATLNGTPMHAGDPVEVQMIGVQSEEADSYTQLLVTDPTGTVKLSPTDKISVLVDTGTLKPESTQSYASRPDIDRYDDRDGTYKVRVTGSPVVLSEGCTDTYPNYCPDTATKEDTVFDVTVLQLKQNREFVGFDRSQSADTVDGLFLQSGRTGDYLETSWDNSRLRANGTTPVKAEARFRVPYAMLVSDFKIPDPASMVDASIAGSVNGAPAVFDLTQDPKGGGVFVDISGVTFPKGNARATARPAVGSATASKPRVIRVKRGAITPTRPVVTRTARVKGTKARVTFVRARARGARITGYQARCQVGRKTLTATGRAPSIVVKGLKRGKKYQCSVRARSTVGYGAWSLRSKV